MATARATAEEYSERTLLIFSGRSISKKIKKLFSAVQMIVTVFEVLLFVLCCLIASIISYCFDKLRCAERAEPGAFWDYELPYISVYSVPVLWKSSKFRAYLFRGLSRSDVRSPCGIVYGPISSSDGRHCLLHEVYIRPSTILPRSEKHFLTLATAEDHANPIQRLPHETVSTLHKQTGTISPPKDSPQENANSIQYQTFCCNGDDVHNQQTDQPVEPVNSPVHNQSGNTSAPFDIEARGTSSNETSSSDVDNETGTSPPETRNQNPPPNDNDGSDETPPNGVNRTSPNEDHNGKKVQFVFMVAAQIIATGIAGLALKSTTIVSGPAIVLRYILTGCMFVSLICLLYALGLSVYKPSSSSLVAWVVRVAARVVRIIGYTVMAITLLAATGLSLPNELMLWVTSVVLLVCLPAIILYAIKMASEDTW